MLIGCSRPLVYVDPVMFVISDVALYCSAFN